MEVVKMGAATGKTEGRIFQIDQDEIWIEPLEDDATPISAGGDSGAIWLDKNLLAPVALHTGTNSTGLIPYARGINIIRVLTELKVI